MNFKNKVGFAIGTGRCGTLFLYQLMDKEPQVASSHERNPDNETFHRFCKWHNLPVDDEGFLAAKEEEIRADLETHAFSFEASPYLSLSVEELHARFGAKFVLLIRRPDRVVTSFAHKGFYRYPYHVKNVNLATGYQNTGREKVHTFFARIAPRGDYLRTWNGMSQIGRVAWFWRAWNERALGLLEALPDNSYRIIRIEDLDYAMYIELSRFLGYQTQVTQPDFDTLSASRPHAFWRKRNVDQWSEREIQEFEDQVGELAQRFDYEYRVVDLIDEVRTEQQEAQKLGYIPPKKEPKLWRLRHTTSQWLRDIAKYVDVE